jgi:hypothetical protein
MEHMTHLPKPSEGGSFSPPPAGTFPAVCYRIIDLGTQQTTWQGKPKKAHKVLISWELHDPEAMTEDGKPMSVHQQYTWSMHEKSRLRHDLESWRGKAFSDADFGPGGFDVKKLLGVPCFLGIVHDTKDGTTYANISAISGLPKNFDKPKAVNALAYSWIEDGLFDRAVFATLSDKMQEKIKSSPEYQILENGGVSEHVSDAGHRPDLDDPIPFEMSWI